MSDLDNAINSINASAAKAENTATFLDDMSTFDDQSSVTNPNNGQTVASIPKQVKDRTDELFSAAESDINQAVSDAAQSATDAQDAADSIGRYQGLWPDTGGIAYKGDTYQTQVSGTPTGQYFTALQNTTVDPIGDNVNWRAVVSNQSLGGLTNYQAASVADMIVGRTIGGKVVLHELGQVWTINGKWRVVDANATGLDKFEPISSVDVKDFMVSGEVYADGAFISARNAAKASGVNAVHFSTGEYMMGQHHEIGGDIILSGDGYSSTLVYDADQWKLDSPGEYWAITAYGDDADNHIQNIGITNLHFKSLNSSLMAFNAFYCDNVFLKNNFISGMGLGGVSDPIGATTIGENDTNAWSTFSDRSKLNHGVTITGNVGNVQHDRANVPQGYVGAAACYCDDFLIANNNFSNARWGIWANGGQGSNTAFDVLRKCRRGTITGNTVAYAHAGIWWSMCEDITCTGNQVHTCDDVCIDPEASNNCVISGNTASHAKTAVYAQFNNSTGVSFTGNVGTQDGVPRGTTGWEGITLYTDSSASQSNPSNRENILIGNSFSFTGLSKYGRIFVNYSEKTFIDSNLFSNVTVDTQQSSTTSFTFTNNNVLFERSSVSESYELNALKTPNGTYSVGSDQSPILITGNFIKAPTNGIGNIGIDFGGNNFQAPSLGVIDSNTVLGFTTPMKITIGSILSGTRITQVKNNTFDGDVIYEQLHTYPTFSPHRAVAIFSGNYHSTGALALEGKPVSHAWRRGTIFNVEQTTSGQPMNYVCTVAGAAFKEEWQSGNTYAIGDYVGASDGGVWIAITENGGLSDPVTDGGVNWEAFYGVKGTFVGYNILP